MPLRRPFFLCLALCLGSLPALQGETFVARDAKDLYELDEQAKVAYEKKFPRTLPESLRKLPQATAKSFDWSKYKVTGPVYTQGRTPYCWAFAATEAFECSWGIRNKGNPILAVQPIIDHTKENGGAPFSLGMRSLVLNGTAPLVKYPYVGRPGGPKKKVPTKYRGVAYGYVHPGRAVPPKEKLKEALLKHGPLVVGVNASKSFQAYRGGVYSSQDKPGENESPINHAILIVGWDDRHGAWKIKNSWDLKWGIQGHMWIRYGSNNVGTGAMWVRAQSIYYNLPEDAHTLLGNGAAPFHRWPSAKNVPVGGAAP